MARKINSFLVDLLACQQDGHRAISAPTNWFRSEPLLSVETPLDEILMDVVAHLQGERGAVGRWQFVIGSPGNGKSAAIGKMCRTLVANGYRILTEDGVLVEDLDSSLVPYALRVYRPEQNFASAIIIQDASVVRRPFDQGVNPALDLISVFQEAWSKGLSLVVCANRGVLERAYQEAQREQRFNTTIWFKILRKLDQDSQEKVKGQVGRGSWALNSRRPVYQDLEVCFVHLESRSLLIGSDIFEQLIKKAVDEAYWAICSDCDNSSLCPFKANRDWLADPELVRCFVQTLRRGEVLDGQVIVFREALALLSFILAGCPNDYDGTSPCEWVGSMIDSGNIVSLAMRRIYMCLYSAFTANGFEPQPEILQRQKAVLQALMDQLNSDDSPESLGALKCVLSGHEPSTDVGVLRLIGEKGIFPEISPSREPLDQAFLDLWDSDYNAILQSNHKGLTQIERACLRFWLYLEEKIESLPFYQATECYWATRRWSSNFMLHFGGLATGRTCWSQELDEYISILELLMNREAEGAREVRSILRQATESLSNVLSTGDAQTVVLTPNVKLRGFYVEGHLRPRISTSANNINSLQLTVNIGGESAIIGARAFAWMRRHLHRNIDLRCMPQKLIAGIIDARSRVACIGDKAYAFVENDVTLEIALSDQTVLKLVRFDGGVYVE